MKGKTIFRTIASLLLLWLASASAWAQAPNVPGLHDPGENYYVLAKKVDSVLASDPTLLTTPGTGIKELLRWKDFWRTRVANGLGYTGDLHYGSGELAKLVNNSFCELTSTSSVPSDWSPLGPMSLPIPAMGMVNAVWYLPPPLDILYCGGNASGLFRARDAAANLSAGIPLEWSNVTDKSTNPIPCIGINWITGTDDGNNIYLATGKTGYVYSYSLGTLRSNDAGLSWHKCEIVPGTFQPMVYKILLDPHDNDRVFAVADEELYISTDGGVTWPYSYSAPATPVGGPAKYTFRDMEILPRTATSPTVTLLLSGNYLMRATWDFSTPPVWADLTPTLPGMLTWSYPNPANKYIAVELSDAEIVAMYASGETYFASGKDRAYYKIDRGLIADLGSIWSPGTKTHTSVQTNIFSVNKTNPDIMYAEGYTLDLGGNARKVMKTTDGGTTFFPTSIYNPTSAPQTTHADIRAIFPVSFSPDGKDDALFIGHDGGISFCKEPTSPGGDYPKWLNANGNGLNISEIYDIGTSEFDSRYINGGLQDNAAIHRNGSLMWSGFIDGGDRYESFFSPVDENRAYSRAYFSSLNVSNSKGVSYGAGTLSTGEGCTDCLHPMPAGATPNGDVLFGWKNVYRFVNGTGPAIPLSSFAADFGDHMGCQRLSAIEEDPTHSNIIYAGFDAPTLGNDLTDPLCNTPSCANCSSCSVTGTTPCLHRKLFKTVYGQDVDPFWVDITPNFALSGTNAVLYCSITSIAIDDDASTDKLWVSFGNFHEWLGVVYNRVNYSSDGGDSWIDYTDNLPNFPVNDIKYQRGGILFAATDVGVFYRNTLDPGSQWECFSNNLPICIVMDLEINYCSNKLRAATFGRGVWETELPPLPSEYVVPLTTSQTWGGNRNVSNDVSVEPGVVLTITGRVNMARDKRIIVKRGGTLIVDGGTLTNQCGYLWGGIEVWGNPSQPQVPLATTLDPQQGSVFLLNDATLEYALVGVAATRKDMSGYGGGRVYAFQSNFKDCRRAVLYHKYPDSNVGLFQENHFLCTGPLPDPAYTDGYGRPFGTSVFFNMGWVKDIRLRGNTFECSYSFDADIQPVGIYSIDATYYVEEQCTTSTTTGCTGWITSKFINLKRGIDFNAGTFARWMRVRRSEFTGVSQGVSIVGGTWCEASNNVFDAIPVWYTNPGGAVTATWGVSVLGSRGVAVTDNVMNSTDPGPFPSNPLPRGVWLQNTRLDLTAVERNVLNGLFIGVQAESNNNRALTRCNDFDGGYAIASLSGKFPTQGEVPVLGLSGKPVENQFNNTLLYPTAPWSHLCYWNTINPSLPSPSKTLLYVYGVSGTFLNVEPLFFTTTASSGGNGDVQKFSSTAAISCVEEPVSPTGSTLRQAHELQNKVNALYASIDKSRATALLALIANPQVPSPALADSLMAHQPLSDAVLTAFVNRNPQPYDPDLAEVLLACSPLSPEVWRKVEPLLPSIAQPHRDNLIREQKNGISPRDQLMQYAYGLETDRFALLGRWARTLLYAGKHDSLLMHLDTLSGLELRTGEIPLLIQKGDFTTATQKLASLDPNTDDLGEWMSQMALQSSLESTGRSYQQLTAQEVALLEQTAAGDNAAAWASRSVLEESGGHDYQSLRVPLPIPLLEPEGGKKKSDETVSPLGNKPALVNCVPNPNGGLFTITCWLPEGTQDAHVSIRSLASGAVLATKGVTSHGLSTLVFDLQQLPAGVYSYELVVAEQTQDVEKLVIVH